MRKFLLGILVGLVLAVLGGIIFFFASLRWASKQKPTLPDQAVLHLKLSGALPELAPMEVPFGRFADRETLSTVEMWQTLRKAAEDPRIRGVLLSPGRLQAGWGKMDELREAILAVRAAGKPVIAHLQAPSARDYYLASAAEEIYLSPEDFLDLKGLRIEASHYKRTLDKLGIALEVEHAGKYKDAADQFSREKMTPETREVLNSLLDETYGRLIAAIAKARKKDEASVRALIDKGPFLANDAKAAGLVDDLLYRDQVEGRLQKRTGLEKIKRISQGEYFRGLDVPLGAAKGPRIGLIIAEGNILRSAPTDMFGQQQAITPGGLTRWLRKAREDSNLRGVLLRIESPGGDAVASDEILREVKELSRRKPVVISMSDVAASGGYYIAMSGDPIVAYPGTLTGSIGVVYGKPDLSGMHEKLGINVEILKRGRYADVDSTSQPLTPEGRAKLREGIDAIYKGFVERVAAGRKRPYEEIEKLAQGRVWLGSQAKANGLVDELGGLNQSLALLKKKAGIAEGDSVRIILYPEPKNFLEELFGSREPDMDAITDAALRKIGVDLELRPWIDGGFLRIMPYRLEIR